MTTQAARAMEHLIHSVTLPVRLHHLVCNVVAERLCSTYGHCIQRRRKPGCESTTWE